ncbi:sulfotransferase [Polymorphospora sp. NPDC051019]|uniref:sulfotransferase family protein n=1 Tax=Polymorphospora sp. NPDC051019 TaxID=3155725 RepID=UPI00342A97AF
MSPVRVLYLAGSGRSGSTLLTTVLGQLDGCFAAGELRYLWQRGILDNRPCGCGAPFAECPLWTRVVAALPAADAGRIAAGLRTRLRMRGLPGLLRRHRAGRTAVPAHPDDAVLAALYTALAEAVGPAGPAGPVIVDSSKLPPYGALLDGLPGIDLRVLHVVRDPRATAFSWRRRRSLDGVPGDRLMSRPPVWKAALLWSVWNAATLRLWGRRAPDRYLRVRYEDFVADPAGTTARIAGFAGLDAGELPFTGPGEVRLAATHSVAGNPSRHRTGPVPITDDTEWITGLSRPGYLVASAVTAPLLRRFGYPLRRPDRPAAGDRTARTADDRPAADLAGGRRSDDGEG